MRALPFALLLAVGAQAQGEPPGPDLAERVPSAWAAQRGERRLLFGARAFFHGASDPHADWRGVETLGYFDLVEGLSGAFTTRSELRETRGHYGTLMLVPRLTPDLYLVGSVGVGSGAPFLPQMRFDLALRARLPERPRLMFEGGLTYAAWPGKRTNTSVNTSVLVWLNPIVVESRLVVNYLHAGFGRGLQRLNGQLMNVALYGEDRRFWWVGRFHVGFEPENKLGVPAADSRDAPFAVLALGYRRWLAGHFGVMLEAEVYAQWETWWRFGTTASVFVDL